MIPRYKMNRRKVDQWEKRHRREQRWIGFKLRIRYIPWITILCVLLVVVLIAGGLFGLVLAAKGIEYIQEHGLKQVLEGIWHGSGK